MTKKEKLSLIVLAVSLCAYVVIEGFRWINKPTDAVYEKKQETIILRDASSAKVGVQIKYRFTGSDDGLTCSPSNMVEKNAYLALILTGIKFTKKDFLSSQEKFAGEFARLLKGGMATSAGICGGSSPEILSIKIKSDFLNNIV